MSGLRLQALSFHSPPNSQTLPIVQPSDKKKYFTTVSRIAATSHLSVLSIKLRTTLLTSATFMEVTHVTTNETNHKLQYCE